SIPPGAPFGTIAVGVRGDTIIEPNKTFLLNLSSPANATLARTQAVGTIVDDETRTTSFTNSSPITIPSSGAATPYPSIIAFSGLPATISKVTVTLSGLSHSYPDDLDVLLVGPTGQGVMVMSDAGDSQPVNNVTLTFDDAASPFVPDSAQISSRSSKPANYFP